MTKPVLGLLLVLAVACAVDEGPVAAPDKPNGLPSGIVVSVDDGDTIEVEGAEGTITVRLLGVNAPDQGECQYDQATSYLLDRLKDEEVELEEAGVDQFGRVLAYVWHDDDLVNLDLVTGGRAIATTPAPGVPYGRMLLEAEQIAFENSVGLWSAETCGSRDESLPLITLTILPDPVGPDDQALEQERITISNQSEVTVDLGGWVLRDESSTHRYVFAPGTALGPGVSLAITSADTSWRPGGSPVWNNLGDVALLLDQKGAVVARLRYP